LRKAIDLDYDTGELHSSLIQAYPDHMILISNSEQNLQTLINCAKNFFDFANIKLNPNKCEAMAIKTSRDDRNIVINEGMKKYVANNKFMKYLEALMVTKIISKTKFL
jgi:hypothetical protein